nr:MAG: replication initiator protein [Microvirus sp.]
MACYKPIEAYRPSSSSSKKLVFSYNPATCASNVPILLPCGQCTGCKLQRSLSWAIRCVHESKLHAENCFITLTYDPKKVPPAEAGELPADTSLNYRHFQLFMKRLRKRFPEKNIRFYMCGEYGENFGRAHFHACIFGLDFPDKTKWKKGKGDNITLYRSKILEELWTYGFSSVGTVTFESAAYVARYITKKITGEAAESHYTFRRSYNRGDIYPNKRIHADVSQAWNRSPLVPKIP